MARRTFTTEFKTAAAKLVTEQRYTQKQAAESLGVDPASIRLWIKLYAPIRNGSSKAPTEANALQAENHRLREENRRLRLEREILKKATAFFAKEQP
jgi:transposase